MNEGSDVMSLLTAIRESLVQCATNRYVVHSYIDAEYQLAKFRQGEKMTCHDYQEKIGEPG